MSPSTVNLRQLPVRLLHPRRVHGDDPPHDVGGAFADLVELGVAQQARDRVLH